MTALPVTLREHTPPTLGLVVLQADERIESDFRRLCPADARLLVSRIPSGADVTPETLAAMERDLPAAVALFPRGLTFDALGYGCTSGAAQIGPERVAALVGARARAVTDPLSALVAACRALGLRRLALVSPYVAQVSARLRAALAAQRIDSPVFGSFDVAEEARVVRITPSSIRAAGRDLVDGTEVDGLFLSCTNLDTLDVIDGLEADIGRPVLSSNQVLAWHMAALAGAGPAPVPGRLGRLRR